MSSKGMYIEIPRDDIEYLRELSIKDKKIPMVYIIRNFLQALRGMDRHCSIVVFDKSKIRLITDFDTPIEIESEYLSYNLQIRYERDEVTTSGSCTCSLGGVLK